MSRMCPSFKVLLPPSLLQASWSRRFLPRCLDVGDCQKLSERKLCRSMPGETAGTISGSRRWTSGTSILCEGRGGIVRENTHILIASEHLYMNCRGKLSLFHESFVLKFCVFACVQELGGSCGGRCDLSCLKHCGAVRYLTMWPSLWTATVAGRSNGVHVFPVLNHSFVCFACVLWFVLIQHQSASTSYGLCL